MSEPLTEQQRLSIDGWFTALGITYSPARETWAKQRLALERLTPIGELTRDQAGTLLLKLEEAGR